MSTICSPFSNQLTTSNLSVILIVFCQFFTRIALGDLGLRFSPIWVTKVNADEGRVTQATCLYHQSYQSIHMTEGMTVTSLSASLLHKTRVAIFHLCQIVLQWKLSLIIYAKSCYTEHYNVNLRSGVNFLVVLKQNPSKRNHVQRDLPVLKSQI
jgi:hypothetical protein